VVQKEHQKMQEIKLNGSLPLKAVDILKIHHYTENKLKPESHVVGLRLVAIFEGAKGAIVLLTGFGVLHLIHKDLHQVAADLIKHFHLNPASKYPLIFLNLAEKTSDANLWALACAALIYSTVRFAEAVGLWMNRRWAEWFGLASGAMYIPVEVFELSKGISDIKILIFLVNILIVTYLLNILFRHPKIFRNETTRA
jgi:uncharacterized membrane protein (DUF2068 family)